MKERKIYKMINTIIHNDIIGYKNKILTNSIKTSINSLKTYLNSFQKNIIKYSVFYKNLSNKFNLNIINTNTFNSSSSSIIKHPTIEKSFLMNTRFVNYSLDSIGRSDINNKKCITVNKISLLDQSFNEIHFKYLYPTNYNSKYIGIEDIRLFNFNDDIYFIGIFYNQELEKKQIVSNKYMYSNDYYPIIINLTFKTDFKWEKNWVFFNNNDKLNIVYKWYTIYICEINYENQQLNLIQTIDNLPSIFKDFRGSTNGLHFDNKIWFIVHQQNSIINNIKSYVHNFVVFDKNMKLLGYSKTFKFENNLVEFCIGMEITDKNHFLITYSTLDSSSKLVIFLPEYVNSLIYYI